MLGVWLVLVGFRLIGRRAGDDARWDAWWSRWGRHCRVLGMVMIAVAGIRLVTGDG